jgi:Tol biopolymer transport system component
MSDSVSAYSTRKAGYFQTLAAISVLLLLALGTWFVRWRWHLHAQPSLTMVPLTSYPGYEGSPTFSPDGNQVAFVWNGGAKKDKFDLYVKEIGMETPVQLTHRKADAMAVAWSPDGRYLAVMDGDIQGGEISMFLMPPMGGSERQLLKMRAIKFMYEMSLAWTPDSQWLVFARGDGEFRAHLVMMNVKTLEERRLPEPSARCLATGMATFSPDGKTMATACLYTWGVSSLFVQPFPTGSAREIREVKGEVEGLQWSRDGHGLIYALDGNLWRISIHGGEPERLWFAQNVATPAMAPAGNRMAYVHQTYSADIWQIALTRNGGAPSRPFPSNLVQQNPQLSSDGKRIAFESTRSGSPEVWVCNADGSEPLQLTFFGGPLTGTPRWSPDGQQIVLDSRASGRAELYVVSSRGGKPQLLPTTTEGGSVPYWSRDGQWIFFASDVNGESQIFKVPAGGGKAVQLTTKGGLVVKQAFDGRLYYSLPRAHSELWSIDVDGHDEQRVQGLSNFVWPAWDLGRRGIYYFDALRGDTAVYFFDFQSRTSRTVVQAPGKPQPHSGQISVSPDEKALLYTQMAQNDADIMLVDGFR